MRKIILSLFFFSSLLSMQDARQQEWNNKRPDLKKMSIGLLFGAIGLTLKATAFVANNDRIGNTGVLFSFVGLGITVPILRRWG